MEIVEKIQYTCIRRILNVPQSKPLPALLGETGILYLEDVIMQKQINMFYRIMNMKNTRLVKQVIKRQIDMIWI